MTGRRVVVFGPAYLDRVVRVDRSLVASGEGGPMDQSVEGEWKFGADGGIAVVASGGYRLDVDVPPDWTGPRGEARLAGPIRPGLTGPRSVRAVACSDDLGGMGAGYAAALGGILHSALGPQDDPTSELIADLIAGYGVDHRRIRILDRPADWTLLVTSGEFGDKLPIGFRGCHAAIHAAELANRAAAPCDVLVVAALPNQLVDPVLRAPGNRTRFFAPALRNMADRRYPLTRFADRVHILSCNRTEWETLEGHDTIAAMVPIIAVTAGPRGSEIRFTDTNGRSRRIHQPAFPRLRPPRDTNRAGEAFASTLIETLLEDGWTGADRPVEGDLMQRAAARASAAAALVLDRLEFGFPGRDEVDVALRAGRVA
jgi:ribokinase